jgi:hypothetical protein
MIILIDGEGGSGKMVLRSLLDGHPELSVLPVHDKIVDALCDYPGDVNWLGERDTVYLRELLGTTYYYMLEKLSLKGYLEFSMSADDYLDIHADFDFHEFDSSWTRRLFQEREWDLELIVRLIHEAFQESLRSGGKDVESLRGYVGVGFDKPDIGTRFLKAYPTGKLLYMFRSVEGILASRAFRKKIDGEATSHVISIEQLLRKNKIGKIHARQQRIRELSLENPDRIMVVDFESLVENTEETMRGIASYLGREFLPILTIGTVLGQEMVAPSGRKYVGKILDRPDDLLSGYHKTLIQLEKTPSALLSPGSWKHPVAVARALNLKVSRFLGRTFGK